MQRLLARGPQRHRLGFGSWHRHARCVDKAESHGQQFSHLQDNGISPVTATFPFCSLGGLKCPHCHPCLGHLLDMWSHGFDADSTDETQACKGDTGPLQLFTVEPRATLGSRELSRHPAIPKDPRGQQGLFPTWPPPAPSAPGMASWLRPWLWGPGSTSPSHLGPSEHLFQMAGTARPPSQALWDDPSRATLWAGRQGCFQQQAAASLIFLFSF